MNYEAYYRQRKQMAAAQGACDRHQPDYYYENMHDEIIDDEEDTDGREEGEI